VHFEAQHENDLAEVAKNLAALIYPPLLVKLHGEVGAGKTTLVSYLLAHWSFESGGSPTFNLRNDYRNETFRVVHLDLYRLKSDDAAWDVLPLDEDFSDAVIFAEWPEKISSARLADFDRTAEISIRVDEAGKRSIDVKVAA